MKFYRLIIPKGFKGSAADLGGGCGPDGSLFDLVPDNFIGVDISVACKIHDYCYEIGGFEADKIKADKMFYQNLKRCVVNDTSLITRTTNLWLAKKYYQAVREFGHKYFNYHKKPIAETGQI